MEEVFNVEDYGGLKDDEYIKDDKIFCKKCNTPRMFVSTDGVFRARCVCKCQKEANEQRQAEAEKLERP